MSSTLLLTSSQVAAKLGLKPQSLRIRRMRGQGPPYIRLSDAQNSRAFYRAEDIEAWIASRPTFSGTLEERAARPKAKGAKPKAAAGA